MSSETSPVSAPVAPTSPANASNDNVMAAVATLPVVGLIMYYGMKDSSALVRHYAKESIGLTVAWLGYVVLSFVVTIVLAVLGNLPGIGAIAGIFSLVLSCVNCIFPLVLLVAWVLLLIKALQADANFKLPMISDMVGKYVK